MAGKIRFEAVYPSSPEDVWAALTDSAAIGAWLMPNDFRPIIGHRFTFRTKPAPGFDGIVQCEVLELAEPKRVAYSWRGGGINTIVSFDLTPEGEGTRLVMEQSGFTGMRGAMVRNILKDGWRKMIDTRLPAVAAQVVGGAYAGSSAPAESD